MGGELFKLLPNVCEFKKQSSRSGAERGPVGPSEAKRRLLCFLDEPVAQFALGRSSEQAWHVPEAHGTTLDLSSCMMLM